MTQKERQAILDWSSPINKMYHVHEGTDFKAMQDMVVKAGGKPTCSLEYNLSMLMGTNYQDAALTLYKNMMIIQGKYTAMVELAAKMSNVTGRNWRVE